MHPLSAQIERIIAEHHQILLSFKASEAREGAEQVRDADDAGGTADLASDPLLIKIAVSVKETWTCIAKYIHM